MVESKRPCIELHNADLGYRKEQPLLQGINLTLPMQGICTVLGQNGTGKTTLFRSLLGLLRPLSGTITLDQYPLHLIAQQELAKLIAYVPQAHTTPFPYRVEEVVMFGRTTHMGFFGNPGRKDREAVDQILDMLELTRLRDRIYTELSGGERQMVIIARALAQEARLLILDEPTSSLDYGNQVRLLKTIAKLARNGTGILMATHQPDHAMLLQANVLLLRKGTFMYYDQPDAALQPEILTSVYGAGIDVIDVSQKGKPSARICRPIIDC